MNGVNITTGELSTWCPECGQTVDVIEPGWVRCPKCLWVEFKAGVSRAADREIEKRRRDEARECYEEEAVRIPLVKKRGGGRKSGRKRKREKKSWWQPWYMRGMGL